MPEIGKKIGELRVCDLKDELEKRKLETVGPKAVLIERLERALKEEGVDPNTHLIESAVKAKKSLPIPMKDTTDVLIKAEPVDTEEGNQAPGEYDGSGDGEDSAHHAVDDGHEIDQVGDVDDVCVILDDDEEDVETYAQEKNDNEATHEADVPEDGEGEPAGFEEMQEENTGDTVNMDNDESINLTIGEEEQKLLHDEAPDDKSIKSVKPANKTDKLSTIAKDGDKKIHKDDEGARSKKKDDKCTDKKDSSDQKSASKSSNQKDDKGLWNHVMIQLSVR
ncbi:SAFB-like transcription modulator isoform X3 [Drosophila hydei]|uniref:SAFB-like transcription modulator isoform X3 n=1 Tax=Drosophila hydei TaxID=7224 RepID=A0A6J1MBI7_DROHY|nr:SAFB-like transcription modulator isoform X3 [Drosophila hydei]